MVSKSYYANFANLVLFANIKDVKSCPAHGRGPGLRCFCEKYMHESEFYLSFAKFSSLKNMAYTVFGAAFSELDT